MTREVVPTLVPPSVVVPVAPTLQPKCACGTALSHARDGCDDCRKKQLQRSAAGRAPPQVPGSVAEVLATTGAPLDDVTRRWMEGRFGASFADIRIHADGRAAASARDIGARAYTFGSHIAFSAGEYAPSTPAGRHLLAHELTHTIQQRMPLGVQRQAEISAAGGAAEVEADRTADQVTADLGAAWIVEDDTQTGPGQLHKSEFLDQMHDASCAAADVQLASVGRSTDGCPYLETAFARYRGYSASRVERAVRLYLPETARIDSASAYIPLVSQSISDGVARWASTGEVSGVPPELMAEAGGALGGGIGGLLSGAAQLLFKRHADSVGGDADAAEVAGQLGGGAPLDSSVRAKMERAFGFDFGAVRIHTDARATALADRLGARAFTVGNDVAVAAHQYRPGTLWGDALLAHELAHVIQQSAGVQTKGAGSGALEEDADRSAVGAVLSMMGKTARGLTAVGREAMPRLRSGLGLQRCKSDPAPTTGTATRTPATTTPATTTPSTDCCCCVENVEIRNVTQISSGRSYGHEFNTAFQLRYTGGSTGTMHDCTLHWWEKSNRGYTTAMRVAHNVWYDMTLDPETSGSFTAWAGRTKPCPGSETPLDTDPPTASLDLPARTLEFRIEVVSGSGCTCAHARKCITAVQVLAPDANVPPGIGRQDFVTPNPGATTC